MPYELLEEKINALPEECLPALNEFIDSLMRNLALKGEFRRNPETLKGRCSLSDDFDEELLDFKEYCK